MGYQQSLVKFESEKDLIEELRKYVKRDKTGDQAFVYGINKTLHGIQPFKKGEFSLIIGGERYPQRNKANLKIELGIEKVKEIVFIDNEEYYFLSNGNLGKFLDYHFKTLTEDEGEELLS